MKQRLKDNIISAFAVLLVLASVGFGIFGYYGGGVLQEGNSNMAELNWSMEPTADYEYLEPVDGTDYFLADCTGKEEKHLIDATGKIIDKLPGEDLGHGYYQCFKNEKAGVADKDGNFLIEPKYDYVEGYGDYFIAYGINERVSIWNLEGKCIHEEPQRAWVEYLGNNRFLVDQSSVAKSYVFDADTGKKKETSEHISFVSSDGKGGFVGNIGAYYYPLDENFDVIKDAPYYEQYSELSEGLRFVTIYDKKTGNTTPCYIDKDGNMAITLEAAPDCAGPFREGKALIQTGNKLLCIDKTGKELFTLRIRQSFSNFQIYNEFSYSEGLAAVSLDDDKYGYIDETGEFVIPPVLDMAWDFEDGYAVAGIDGKEFKRGILKLDQGVE